MSLTDRHIENIIKNPTPERLQRLHSLIINQRAQIKAMKENMDEVIQERDVSKQKLIESKGYIAVLQSRLAKAEK